MSDDMHSQPAAPVPDEPDAAIAAPDEPATAPAAPTERAGDSHRAVERARADLAAGREWKARERLLGYLADHYDPEALELLGEVHHVMRDLPSAGAAWFGTTRTGPDVDEAVQAWRERHGDHFPEMWRSLPRLVREREGNARVDALRRRAEVGRSPASARRPASAGDRRGRGGVDAAVVIAIALAVLFVVCAVVGFITVLGWIVPG